MSFYLYKLAGSMATPLGIAIFFGTLLSLILLKYSRRIAVLLILTNILLIVLSLDVTANYILKPLEDIKKELPSQGSNNTAILVLSAGFSQSLTDEATPGPFSISRLMGGIKLSKEMGWPIILSGGLGLDGRDSLALSMKRYSIKMGYKGEILLDELSRTTWENMQYSYKIAQKRGFKNIVLVTNSFHMKRSLWMAQKVMTGIKIYPYPVCPIGDRDIYTSLDFIPSAGALYKSTIAWREYLGLIVYRFIDFFSKPSPKSSQSL